jgi:hypothetical protein
LEAVVEVVMVVVFGGVGVGVVAAVGCGGFGGVVKRWRS